MLAWMVMAAGCVAVVVVHAFVWDVEPDGESPVNDGFNSEQKNTNDFPQFLGMVNNNASNIYIL